MPSKTPDSGKLLPDNPNVRRKGKERSKIPAKGSHASHMGSSGRGMVISARLTGVYFVIEMGIGHWTWSSAVILDAFDTFFPVGGVLVAITVSSPMIAHKAIEIEP